MPTIRKLRQGDMTESLRLSEFAFQYELSPVEREDRLTRLNPEDSLGCFLEEGQLAAKLTVLPLQTYVGGQAFAMGGIAGVATWPEHRRGGLVKQLLHTALLQMKEAGQTISMLHPFQFEFYRRFGWETYTEYKKYELSMGQLPRLPDPGGRVVRGVELKVLEALYERYAARFNGTLVRTDSWWKWNILTLKNKGGQSAVYYGVDGSPKGYVLYQVKDQVLTVREWVALDSEARAGLWRFLANHDSMAKQVVLQQTEAGERLTSLLADPRVKQETVPYFMARLTDVAGFLRLYRFREGAEGVLRFEVTDEHAPWNEGLYELFLDGSGGARVQFVGRVLPEESQSGFRCGVGVLTALLLGYETPSFWREAGRLQGDDAAIKLLERCLPDRSTCLLDFF